MPQAQEPLAIQKCDNGLICVYGICNISADNVPYCSCDPGAYGVNCCQPCCLNCGEHGTCVLNNSGQETCSCQSSFTGVLCETKGVSLIVFHFLSPTNPAPVRVAKLSFILKTSSCSIAIPFFKRGAKKNANAFLLNRRYVSLILLKMSLAETSQIPIWWNLLNGNVKYCSF